MLRPRIIPCLLIRNKGLVKTVGFKDEKYVGDPLNAVRIFNEKKVDELIVIDIDATVLNQPPDFELIKKLAAECRMPLCYGGGVKNVAQAREIVRLGAEKVSISSGVIENLDLIPKFASAIGSQSVVVSLDIKRKLFGGYEILTHNGNKKTKIDPIKFIEKLNDFDIGELVITSIENDGLMKGYDIELIEKLRNITTTPITVIGGAGSITDISNLINKFGVIGAGAGSLFVFKGKYKAVLISYPSLEEKLKLIEEYI